MWYEVICTWYPLRVLSSPKTHATKKAILFPGTKYCHEYPGKLLAPPCLYTGYIPEKKN